MIVIWVRLRVGERERNLSVMLRREIEFLKMNFSCKLYMYKECWIFRVLGKVMDLKERDFCFLYWVRIIELIR